MGSKRFRVSILHIALYADFLVLFNAQLIPFNYRLPFEVVVLLCLSCYVFSSLKLKEIFNSTLFCLLVIVSLSIINYLRSNISVKSLIECIIHYYSLILFYDILMIFNNNGKNDEIIRSLINILMIYTIFNVVSVLFIGVNDFHNLIYFFGNKFRVSYYLIYLLGLIYCLKHKVIKKNKLSNIEYVLLVFVVMAFMYYIGCKTAVVSIAFFLILSIFAKKEYKLLANPLFVLLCIIASGFIIYVIDTILNYPLVERIITLLNEDISLTGRTRIYSMYLFPLISKSLYIGYGYGNTAMLSYSTVFGNAQNGMFEYILTNGVVGLVFFCIIIIRELKMSTIKESKYGLYLILFSMIITAIAEVTFGAFLLAIVFIIRWYNPKDINVSYTGKLK